MQNYDLAKEYMSARMKDAETSRLLKDPNQPSMKQRVATLFQRDITTVPATKSTVRARNPQFKPTTSI